LADTDDTNASKPKLDASDLKARLGLKRKLAAPPAPAAPAPPKAAPAAPAESAPPSAESIAEAREQGMITPEQAQQLERDYALRRKVIMVDDFAPEELRANG